MKIAIVSGDDVCRQGMSAESLQLSAALGAYGETVTAHIRRQAGPPHDAADRAYQIVSADVGPPAPAPAAEVLPFVGEWAAQLDRIWSAEPPDIVHSFGWLGGLAGQLAARRHQLPTVQSFHGLATTTSSGPDSGSEIERARFEPLLARDATWVTAGSTDELGALTQLRRKRAHLSVLTTGVDIERFRPTGPKRADNGLLRVLQLEPNALPCNGFANMIRVLPRITGIELVIAETDEAQGTAKGGRAELNRLASELGVADRTRFAGTVAHEDLPSLIRSADIVACTPQHAPRATTALQAMASGVVVVGVAVGALVDTVINGVTGLLVSPSKPHELATALKSLHRQRFQRESMGSAGRARVMSRFTWDRIALDALNIYRQTSSANSSAIA